MPDAVLYLHNYQSPHADTTRISSGHRRPGLCCCDRFLRARPRLSASTTKVADAVCVVCTSGTVSAAEDNNECAAHAVTDCAAGRELTPGNAHKDGACAVCAAGKFNAETSTDPCAAHTVTSCSSGSEEIDGTSTVDSHCVSCTSGKFSTGGGSVRLSTHGSFKLF